MWTACPLSGLSFLLLQTSAIAPEPRTECWDWAAFPQLRAELAVAQPHALAASGHHLYVLRADSPVPRLVVVDIADQSAPVVLGSVALDAATIPATMVADGGRLYVGSENRGLDVFGLADPAQPVAMGFLPTTALDLDVQGDLVYVARGAAGVQVVDVSNPAQPVEIGATSERGATRLSVDGGLLAATHAGDLFTFDVAVPAAPTFLDEELAPEASPNFRSSYVEVELIGSTVLTIENMTLCDPDRDCCSDLSGLEMFDALPSGTLAFVRRVIQPPYHASQLLREGERLCMFGAGHGTHVFDVADPAAPRVIHRLLTRASRGTIAAAEDAATLCVIEGRGTAADAVHLYDVTNAELPHGVTLVPQPSRWTVHWDVAVTEQSAYVIGFSAQYYCSFEYDIYGFIRRYDLENPAADARSLPFQAAGTGYGFLDEIDASGGDLYMATGNLTRTGDLFHANIPVPNGPFDEPVEVPLAHSAYDAVSLGDHLLVTGGTAGFSVVETGGPGPVVVATVTGGSGRAVDADGDLAVTVEGADFRTIDLSTITAPSFAGQAGLSRAASWVALEQPVAAVGFHDGLVQLVDVSDRFAPVPVAAVELPDPRDWAGVNTRMGRMGADMAGGILYATSGAWGVTAVDVSEPYAPVVLGTISTDQSSRVLATRGRVFVARFGGLSVFSAACPAGPSPVGAPVDLGRAAIGRLAISRVSPNPSHGRALIEYALPRSAHVVIDLVDVRGRRVRELWAGPRPAGAAALEWDGRARDGHLVAPGVYFVRLADGDGVAVRKLLRLR